MKAAVVIVTYNAERYVPDCLGSLARMDRSGMDVDVIVIDNGSTDATVAMLHDYPFAELHVSERNLGFAGGNNLGVRMAMDRGAEFIYLLNHDTEVAPEFLKEAVAAAVADPEAGSVQSLLLLSPDKTLVNSTGNAVHFLGFGYCLDYRRTATQALAVIVSSRGGTALREIAYASGAGVLLRTAALAKSGLFDEELFMYHEDLDLGWRLRLAGWRNVLAPKSVVWHKYEFSRSVKKLYYMERNRYAVALKNLRVWSLAVLLPWMLLAEPPLFLAALRGGWWREKLRAYAWFFRPASWRHVLTGRRAVAALRTVSDREIVRLWKPTIGYQEVSGPFTRYVANPLMTAAWAALRLLIV